TSIPGIPLGLGGTSTSNNFFTRRTTSTALLLTTGSSSSTYGDSLTFTATVTSASDANPTSGSVTFKDSGTTICGASLSGTNVASCVISTLNVADNPHSITAVYGGTSSAPGFRGSTYTALTYTIRKEAFTVTADADPATLLQDAFSKTYGASDPSFTVRYSGFAGTDTVSSLGGSLAFTF